MAFEFFKPNNTDTNAYPDPYANPPDRKKVILVFALGGALLISLILFALTLFAGDPKGDYMKMLAQHENLVTTVEESQPRIRNTQFSKVNSSAALLLAGDSVTLSEQLKKKFGVDKLGDDAKKRAADPTIAEDLQEAVLLDKFDVTYRNILLIQLNDLILQAAEVQDAAGGKELRAVLDKYIEDLKAIATQLDALENI